MYYKKQCYESFYNLKKDQGSKLLIFLTGFEYYFLKIVRIELWKRVFFL